MGGERGWLWWLLLLVAAWLAIVGMALYHAARDRWRERERAQLAARRPVWPDKGLA